MTREIKQKNVAEIFQRENKPEPVQDLHRADINLTARYVDF